MNRSRPRPFFHTLNNGTALQLRLKVDSFLRKRHTYPSHRMHQGSRIHRILEGRYSRRARKVCPQHLGSSGSQDGLKVAGHSAILTLSENRLANIRLIR